MAKAEHKGNSLKFAKNGLDKKPRNRSVVILLIVGILILVLLLLVLLFIAISEKNADLNNKTIIQKNNSNLGNPEIPNSDLTTQIAKEPDRSINSNTKTQITKNPLATTGVSPGSDIKNKRSNIHADGIVTNIWLDGESHLTLLRRNGIRYLFVDIGGTDEKGKIDTPKEEITSFIGMVNDYELTYNYTFVLLAYSEINTEKYQLSDTFLDNMVDDYSMLSKSGFDGILVDIEPVKYSQRDSYLQFLQSLRKDMMNGSLITIYAGNILNQNFDETVDGNEYMWGYDFYKKVSRLSDIIVIQGYDEGIESESEYKQYIKDQIRIINSDEWDCDFMLGVPTHNPSPETIKNSLDAYENDDIFNAKSNFIGVSIFAEWTIKQSDWKTYRQMRYID